MSRVLGWVKRKPKKLKYQETGERVNNCVPVNEERLIKPLLVKIVGGIGNYLKIGR
jgi:hypothetical protein